MSGWWFGTFFIFPFIGNFIIPIDFHIFQRGGITMFFFLRNMIPSPCHRGRSRSVRGDGLRRLMGQLAEPNNGWIPIFDPETGSGGDFPEVHHEILGSKIPMKKYTWDRLEGGFFGGKKCAGSKVFRMGSFDGCDMKNASTRKFSRNVLGIIWGFPSMVPLIAGWFMSGNIPIENGWNVGGNPMTKRKPPYSTFTLGVDFE